MNLIGFADMVRDEIEDQGLAISNVSEMEYQIRASLQELGAVWLSEWLELVSRKYTAPHWQCPQCDELARYERQREASLHTLLGTVCYKRAVYACGACGHRHYPMDEGLGLRANEMSAEVERLAAQMGVHLPFAQASTLFEELT